MAKKAKAKPRARKERRFFPHATTNRILVMAVGGFGAAALGAGVWGHFWGHFEPTESQPVSIAIIVAGVGAIMTGIAVWLGTTGDPAVRVGDAGFAVERGELVRVPWHGLIRLGWDEGAIAATVKGTDEAGRTLNFKLPVVRYAQAVAWLVKEAEARVPKVVDVPDEVVERLPAPSDDEGMPLALEPIQVVGKRCAKSGRVIAYEPDARVCVRCERVYFKTSVPSKCKCGAVLTSLRDKDALPEEPEEEEEEHTDEPAAERADAEPSARDRHETAEKPADSAPADDAKTAAEAQKDV